MQPTLICSHPWKRAPRVWKWQLAAEALELEIPLRAERITRQEVREPVDLARARWRRRRAENSSRPSSLIDCAQQPPTPTMRAGSSRLSRRASPRWESRRLSAASRIEQVLKRIRSAIGACRRLGVAERLEHPAHALGVVLVHLAAERGDVERLSHRCTVAGGVAADAAGFVPVSHDHALADGGGGSGRGHSPCHRQLSGIYCRYETARDAGGDVSDPHRPGGG